MDWAATQPKGPATACNEAGSRVQGRDATRERLILCFVFDAEREDRDTYTIRNLQQRTDYDLPFCR